MHHELMHKLSVVDEKLLKLVERKDFLKKYII